MEKKLHEQVMSAEDTEYEDMIDATIADAAYREYVKSGCKSTPVAEFWEELNLED